METLKLTAKIDVELELELERGFSKARPVIAQLDLELSEDGFRAATCTFTIGPKRVLLAARPSY